MNFHRVIFIIEFISTALFVYPITDSINLLKNDLIEVKEQKAEKKPLGFSEKEGRNDVLRMVLLS